MTFTNLWHPLILDSPVYDEVIPQIARELYDAMIQMNILLSFGSILTFTFGFGLLAFKIRESNQPKAIWVIGIIQALFILGGFGLNFTGPIYSVSILVSIGGLILFSIWMIIMSITLFRGVMPDLKLLVKGSGVGFVIASVLVALAVCINVFTGFWEIMYTEDMLEVPMMSLAFVGIIGIGVAMTASVGMVGLWKTQSGRRRVVPSLGMISGLLLMLCSFVMIPILLHIVAVLESRFSLFLWRDQLISELNATLLTMDVLFIAGACLVFLFGNILTGVFNKDLALPSEYKWLNLTFGLAGVACAVLAFLLPWTYLYDGVSQIVLVLIFITFIMMGVGMLRYREPIKDELVREELGGIE